MPERTLPKLRIVIPPQAPESRTIMRIEEEWPEPFPQHEYEIEPHTSNPFRKITTVRHAPSERCVEIVLEPAGDDLIDRLLAKKPLGWRIAS